MSNFGQNARGVPFAFCPKCPISMAELQKPQQIGNTYRISVPLIWLDAEFILVPLDTITRINKQLLAENASFLKKCSK